MRPVPNLPRAPLLALGVVALLAGAVKAGVPDPSRTVCRLSDPLFGCHYVFRADGGLDVLTVHVTLLDAFDIPLPSCSTSVTLALAGPLPGGGDCGYAPGAGGELCSCCPLTRTEVSAVDGSLFVTFANLGGRGALDVLVSVQCVGPVQVCDEQVLFTSPDLDGTCEPSGGSTGILDFGIWAGCYQSVPCHRSDYNCDCSVDVLDVAVYAGGLQRSCADASCP